jgi:hypothetical protein
VVLVLIIFLLGMDWVFSFLLFSSIENTVALKELNVIGKALSV